MSLIQEIRNQPPLVRHIMYWLSVVVVLGGIGFFWFTSVERNMFFAIHPDPTERQQFVAQQDQSVPQPLALVSKAFSSLTASIGTLFGFDNSKGLDKTQPSDHTQDSVHPLPLSQ